MFSSSSLPEVWFNAMILELSSSSELNSGSLCPETSPRSRESLVSVSVVVVTLVTCVEAESVEVLIVASDVVDDPITTTFGTVEELAAAAATAVAVVAAVAAILAALLARAVLK